MSAAFTTITTDEQAETLEVANELHSATLQRYQAANEGSSPSWVSSFTSNSIVGEIRDPLMGTATIQILQSAIESMYPLFLDHENAPNQNDWTGEDEIGDDAFYTEERFREVAGLNAAGWRRTTIHPESPNFVDWEYGLIQDDDVTGWWNEKDMQKALKALRWTYVDRDLPWGVRGDNTEARDGRGTHSGGDTCDDVRDKALADWNSTAWTSAAANIYLAWSIKNTAAGGSWRAERNRAKLHLNLAAVIPCAYEADLYLRFVNFGIFTDMDGLGATEDKLLLVESLEESSDTDQFSDYVGVALGATTLDECPIITTGMACPITATETKGISDEIFSEQAVLRWNFTLGEADKIYNTCLVDHTSSSNFFDDNDAGYWVDTDGWTTTMPYVVDDVVHRFNKVYICLADHTAGNFKEDLDVGNWGITASSDWAEATEYTIGDIVVIPQPEE